MGFLKATTQVTPSLRFFSGQGNIPLDVQLTGRSLFGDGLQNIQEDKVINAALSININSLTLVFWIF